MDKKVDLMIKTAVELGAYRAGFSAINQVVFDRGFRAYCDSNTCGKYGKCWTCPPDIGEIDELIKQAQSFTGVIVYQTVTQLADSFDFEGMMAAGRVHNNLAHRIGKAYAELPFDRVLHLGAGGCHVCEVCSKTISKPCPYPEKAIASLEAYGIDVSCLAKTAGLDYINGENTVTYFGAYFFR